MIMDDYLEQRVITGERRIKLSHSHSPMDFFLIIQFHIL